MVNLKEFQNILIDIPAVKRMMGFNQHNRAHQYELWEHCVQTFLNLPNDIEDDMLYMAALLHDIGKPDCQVAGTREGDTNMHYYNHPKRSMEIVKDVVIPYLLSKELILSEEDQRRLLYYVQYHDDRATLRINYLRNHLKIASFKEFQNLMQLQVADAKAHVLLPIIQKRIEICTQLAGEYGCSLYERILSGE